MQHIARSTKTTILSLLLLVAFASGLFAYSVDLRRSWFGTSPVCPETWLTSATLLCSREWYQEGPWHLRFGLVLDPNSIESPDLASREVYCSYPPGVILPIYALSQVLRREPSLKMLMAYGLFNHLAISVLLSFIAFFFVRRCGFGPINASLLASIPVVAFLFLPSPFYEFQMGYLHDLAVLLPFAAYVFLECVRDQTTSMRARTILSWLQGLVAFFGILCDWLFAFVVFSLYMKRLAAGEIATWSCTDPCSPAKILGRFLRNSVRFWFSFALAVGLFVLQLYHYNGFRVILGRFRERTGVTGHSFLSPTLDNRFWNTHMVRGYGTTGRTLVYVSFVALLLLIAYAVCYRVLRKRSNASVNAGAGLMFLLLVPCVLQVFVFAQHSSHMFHYFSTAKFALPIAIIPFVLLPVSVLMCLRYPKPFPLWGRVIPPMLVALAAWYVYGQSPRLMPNLVPPFGSDPVVLGACIDRHTDYADVVFTPDPGLETVGTPVLLAETMKRVYLAASVERVRDKLAGVTGEYVVNYLVPQTELTLLGDDIQWLITYAYASEPCENLVLYKVRKADFLRLCGELGLPS